MKYFDFTGISEKDIVKHIIHHLRQPTASINSLVKLLLINKEDNETESDNIVFINSIGESGLRLNELKEEMELWLENNKKYL